MKLATQISLGLFIVISIDLVDSYVNYSLTRTVNVNTDFLTSSESVIRTSGDLNRGIVEMQNAFRGFLLTGDQKFLDRYDSGLIKIPALIRQEGKLIRAAPVQQARLDSIVSIHDKWLKYASRLIDAKIKVIENPLFDRNYNESFQSQVKESAGKNYNERIATIFWSFDQYEYNVRQKRRERLSASIIQTDQSSLLFSLLLILAGSAIAVYMVKKISGRIDSMVKLAENISQGNFTAVYDNKKDELTGLSTSLNLMSQTLSRNITELEKKNDELNQFAYVVSHDLKAPIRGISNVVQWIKEDLADEISLNMKNYLDIIRERIKRMGDLIDGLLEYARVGRGNHIKEVVDVSFLVGELGDVIVPKAYKFMVDELPLLSTERILLEQVFANLLSNAVKYTCSEDAAITVSCTTKGNFYEFSVADNGIGIDEAYHDKIFGMFQTLREKHDKESTGIGLAVVRKIVEEKGGLVMVSSLADSGSKFVFTWPKD